MAFNFKSLLHFVYPPLCLHCLALLLQRCPVLCSCCLEQLSLVPAQERCFTCFSLLQKGRCDTCIQRPVVIRRQIAALERMGPAATLLQYLLRGDRSVVAPLSALMAYQWLDYKMPLPDLIIPLPPFCFQSVNPSLLLAKEVGRTFSVPVLSVLKKTVDSQAFVTEGVCQSKFEVKKKRSELLCDRKLLLIADTLDDRLLRRAAEVLQPFFPMQIYALAAVC